MMNSRILETIQLFLCLAVFTCIVLVIGIMIGAFWMDEFFPVAPTQEV